MPTDAVLRPRSLSRKAKKHDDDEGERSAVDDHHPLRASTPRTPTFASSFDGTLTRPNLRRQLRGALALELDGTRSTMLAELADGRWDNNDGRSRSYSESASSSAMDDWTSTPGASSSASTPPEPRTSRRAHSSTREVIIHEVQPTDSLAGVALLYGVKVAALRKANKMWPSDSIHLRKVLYIPVDWQKSRPSTIGETDERPPPSPTSRHPSSLVPHADGSAPSIMRERSSSRLPSSYDDALSPSDDAPQTDTPNSRHHRRTRTIQISASELSFFPSRPTLLNTNTSDPIVPPLPPEPSSFMQSSYFSLPYRTPNTPRRPGGSTSLLSLFGTMGLDTAGSSRTLNGNGMLVASHSASIESSVSSAMIARSSLSDDGRAESSSVSTSTLEAVVEVELDEARDSWRTTPAPAIVSPTTSRHPSHPLRERLDERARASSQSSTIRARTSRSPTAKGSITSQQPTSIAPMSIPSPPPPSSHPYNLPDKR